MVEGVTIDDNTAWEDPAQQHDFFGDVNLVEDVITSVEKDDIEEKKEDKTSPEVIQRTAEEAEEKLIEDQFKDFGQPTGEEDEDGESPTITKTDDKKEVDTPTTKIDSKSTLEFLKEKGLVNFELEEGEELTEAKAEEMLEDTWESSIEGGVEEIIKDLPKELKDLIKFSAQGGNVGELLVKMAGNATSGITKDSDISQEATQVSAITMDLKAQGYDQEYIDTQIDFLKTSKKLEAISKKSFDRIVADQEASTEQEVTRAKQERDNKKKSAREYKTSITSHIGELDEVRGLAISKADKLALPTYISDPNVELQDGRLVSEFQADLFKVMGDKDKVTLLAKLIKSDFDFSSISRKKQTEAARNIRSAVQNTDKKNVRSTTGVHSKSKKAIWDLLD